LIKGTSACGLEVFGKVFQWHFRVSLSAVALLLPLLLVTGSAPGHGCLSVSAGFGDQGSAWPAMDLVLTLGALWWPRPRRRRPPRRADKYRRRAAL
jgi:hypothetical protein